MTAGRRLLIIMAVGGAHVPGTLFGQIILSWNPEFGPLKLALKVAHPHYFVPGFYEGLRDVELWYKPTTMFVLSEA